MNVNPVDIKRITIIGNGGSGKTYFSLKLSAVTDIPVFHLDNYYWIDGKAISSKKWEEVHARLLEGKSWIIEGTALQCIQERFAYSDLIIWLDTNCLICILRVLKKLFQSESSSYGYPKNPIRNIEFILKFHFIYKKKLLSSLKIRQNKVIILKNKKDISNFLAVLKKAWAKD